MGSHSRHDPVITLVTISQLLQEVFPDEDARVREVMEKALAASLHDAQNVDRRRDVLKERW